MLIYLYVVLIILLLFIIGALLYERKKMRRQFHAITAELKRILQTESDEKVMLFTNEKELASLMEQINWALESRQKTKTDYRKSELNTKQMLSNVSHDMKTPLTVILGYLEIMKLDERYRTSMVDKVEKKANQLMEMIQEFFTLAKIEAGDIELSMTRIRIDHFCEEIIVDFYEILTEKDFQVEIQIPKKELYVYTDPKILKRILLNLITNALRYGAEGKFLGLGIQYDEHTVKIDIIDKGKGIGSTEKEHVFDRLYRSDAAGGRDVPGSGLGLAIAKGLADKTGAAITLVSEPHVRTVFTLELVRMEY